MIEKNLQRERAYKARNAQVDKDKLSQIICTKFVSQASYKKADTVMWYVHCRSEVRTINALTKELNGSKRIVVPFCTKDDNQQNKLGLWILDDLDELIPGTWGILEPPQERWNEKIKTIAPQEIDVIMVPGVAFDCNGGRLGNGAGYYDRLLQDVRLGAVLTAVCYESQVCEKVIMEDHDITMDHVLTEKNCY
ncbi:MAG: 5-formyltetrahydrofolate cyclo-ligase [Methylococcales bacterium]|nr:5-formyltetrahydrofolate cyclo-ligase [Methylococcales bacterium]